MKNKKIEENGEEKRDDELIQKIKEK